MPYFIWEGGSWKRAEFERVEKSQSVTTFEKPSSESIAEATRWLPTSFMPFLRACTDTFRRPIPLKVSKSNVRQRTDHTDVFTTETSCLTIVWATMQHIRLHPHLAAMKLKS